MQRATVDPERIAALVESAADAGFTGAVRVDIGDEVVHQSAHGSADRAHDVDNTVDTLFAAASATKGFTALVAMRLVDEDRLTLDTTVRSIVGDELPLVSAAVTVRHLLAHRSGLAEYCPELDDEPATGPGAPTVTQCHIVGTDDVISILRDLPMIDEPGAVFSYNNSGYVVLAAIVERITGLSIGDAIAQFVVGPAGLARTAMLRYDELTGDAAVGYVDRSGLRTNVHAVPNRGVGDGGLFTTLDDMARFWRNVPAGAVVGPASWTLMTTPQGRTPRGTPYGLGFWLDSRTDAVALEGADHGISFRSVHHPSAQVTWTVISNWTDGAWPLVAELTRELPGET